MFRLITVEREYGCGGAPIAAQLADHLGWKLWDHGLTEEIARLANVDPSAVMRCDERMDSRLYRLAKAFWRGSYERSSPLGNQAFDTDRMMSMMQEITARIAEEGSAVVVGQGGLPAERDQEPEHLDGQRREEEDLSRLEVGRLPLHGLAADHDGENEEDQDAQDVCDPTNQCDQARVHLRGG